MAQLRQVLRRLALAHALPVELRAQLVLSVTTLARPALRTGRPVAVEATFEPGADGHTRLLVVVLRSPHALDRPAEEDLPLSAESVAGGKAVWRVPVPTAQDPPRPARIAPPNGAGPAPDDGADGTGPYGTGSDRTGAHGTGPYDLADGDADDAAEEELRALLARADALAAEHRRLKHELAETNSGVLALYVQLEERDEQLRTAHGHILRELEDALRPPPIGVDGLELAVHYAPAGTDAPTGGDLYDWFTLPDGTVHITVVDALGHGVRSTRSALNVTHAVRTLALEGHPLQSIVARTDEILLPFDRDLMATVLLVRVSPETGEVHLANGSHPPALLVRADGSADYLDVRGRGIGFPLPGSERLRRERLAPGDVLVLYTDGLTESRRDPREGENRLVEAVRKHARRPLDEVPGAIAEEMHTVILHADDTLALAVRLTCAPR